MKEYFAAQPTKQEVDPVTPEQSANFEGNDSILLFERLDDPVIFDQIVKMWMFGYEARAASGEPETKVRYDENGDMAIKPDGSLDTYEEPYVAPSEAEVRQMVIDQIEQVKTSTPISFDDGTPNSGNIPIFWCMPGGATPTLKQKSIMLAHEKGHEVRRFPGGLEGDLSYKRVFDTAIDSSRITYSQEQYKDDAMRLQKAAQQEGVFESEEEYTYESTKEILVGYLSDPQEIVERMGQLKNYFGFFRTRNLYTGTS
tara:strand:+ start:1838 stop:2605 length:768 start_codon:yes stop_codon:yes gene_type:complete